MATAYATSSQGNYRVKLTYTNTNNGNATSTISLTAELQAKGKWQAGYQMIVKVDGTTVIDKTSSELTTPSDWHTFATGTWSGNYTQAHSTKSVSVTFSFSGKNDTVNDYYAGNQSASSSVTITIPIRPSYTVSYNANGGSGAPSSQTKWYGETLTLSTTKPTKANASAGSYTITFNANGGSCSTSTLTANRTTSYAFSKWNTASGGTGTNYSSGASYTSNSAATMYAQYTSSTTTASITLPTATRSNYTFNGWYTASSGGTKIGNAGASYTPTSTRTVYAQWTEITYTVSYNKGANGSGTNTSDTGSYNSIITLKGAIFTRTGYTQDGWSLSDGGSNYYSLSSSYTITKNITLYPHWDINKYTITYNANGGSGAPSSQIKEYGATKTLSSTKPTKTRASAGSYTVSYNLNGGTSSVPSSSTASKWTNYTFSKWNTKSDGTGTSYNAGGSYTANANVTLYAQYTSSASTDSITLPSAPTRSNYAFKGWYTASSGGTKAGDAGASYTPASSITLYAQWTQNSYTITYNANGGSFTSGTSSTQTKPSGTDVTLYNGTKVTRSGYTLSGWATSASGSVQYAAGATFTENNDKTLYAKWTLSYTAPVITGYGGTGAPICYRCDSNGVADDEGKYCRVTFRYTTFSSSYPATSVVCERKTTSASGYSSAVSESAMAGYRQHDCDFVYGSNQLNIDYSYNIRVTVGDDTGSSSYVMTLSTAFFTMDFGSKGKSIGVGRAAVSTGTPSNGRADFGMDVHFNGDVYESRAYKIKDLMYYPTNRVSISSAGWYRVFKWATSDNISRAAQGFFADITVATSLSNTANVVHRISLFGTYAPASSDVTAQKIVFLDETSKSYSSTNVITKIRYTTDGSGNGYIDVYYNDTSANYVKADIVQRPFFSGSWSDMGFASVDSAPTGETVRAEYTFASNFNIDDRVMYKAGDTESFSYFIMPAGIYNNGKQVNMTLNLPKQLDKVLASGITITEFKGLLTGVNGGVGGTSLSYDWLADSNLSLGSTSPWKASSRALGITFNAAAALSNAVNGSPAIVYVSSLKLSFS